MHELEKYFPVVYLGGPRQSGKTTLLKHLYPDFPYANLENPDTRSLAELDTRRFLTSFPSGAILNEVQRSPELFSYLQGIVDADRNLKFILSGSQNFLMMEKITQSLHYGNIMENMLMADLYKKRSHRGERPQFWFWRDSNGNEVDLLIEDDGQLRAIEIKSSKTFNTRLLSGLTWWRKTTGYSTEHNYLIYLGDQEVETDSGALLPWKAALETI